MANTTALEIKECESVWQYIALQTVRIAITDLINAYKDCNEAISNIKNGIDVKLNERRKKRFRDKIAELERFFGSENQYIFNSFDCDSTELLSYIKRKFNLGFSTPEIEIEVKPFDFELTVDEKTGQFCFHFD